MFGRYFAPGYFARRYFGGSGEAAPAGPLVRDPRRTLRGRDERVRRLSGNRLRGMASREPRKRKL